MRTHPHSSATAKTIHRCKCKCKHWCNAWAGRKHAKTFSITTAIFFTGLTQDLHCSLAHLAIFTHYCHSGVVLSPFVTIISGLVSTPISNPNSKRVYRQINKQTNQAHFLRPCPWFPQTLSPGLGALVGLPTLGMHCTLSPSRCTPGILPRPVIPCLAVLVGLARCHTQHSTWL